MGTKIEDFLKDKKIDPRRILATSVKIERLQPEDRAIRLTKRLMKEHDYASLNATMIEEMRHFGEMLQAPEAKEAFQAFLEKRKPDFTKFS